MNDKFRFPHTPRLTTPELGTFSNEERMVQLKAHGWPGQLKIENGKLMSRNHPEATTDRWFEI